MQRDNDDHEGDLSWVRPIASYQNLEERTCSPSWLRHCLTFRFSAFVSSPRPYEGDDDVVGSMRVEDAASVLFVGADFSCGMIVD